MSVFTGSALLLLIILIHMASILVFTSWNKVVHRSRSCNLVFQFVMYAVFNNFVCFVTAGVERQFFFVTIFFFHVYSNGECFVIDQKVMQQFFLWEECFWIFFKKKNILQEVDFSFLRSKKRNIWYLCVWDKIYRFGNNMHSSVWERAKLFR